jgi:hypothetical protein
MPAELEALLEAEGAPVDPYPDLPVLAPDALRDGDVLLMLGVGSSRIPPLPFPVPVSWLIRKLDGGAYSHATIVTWEPPEAGARTEPRVWDHSRDWALGPVPLADALQGHAWCHVARFEKDGRGLDDPRFPRDRVPAALRPHAGEPYDKLLLILAGVVALLARMPADPTLRRVLREVLDRIVTALEWALDHRDIRTHAFVCTAVPCVAFWQACHEVPHDYALEVDLERRRTPAPEPDPAWEAMRERLREVLTRVYPDLDAQLASWRTTVFGGNAHWVPAGSRGLPVNLVSPSDLEFSRTLVRVGKLAVPGA